MTIKDDQLRDLLASRADRARPERLEALIVSALAGPAPRSSPLRFGSGGLLVLVIAALVVVSLLATSIGSLSGLFGVAPVPGPSSAPSPAVSLTPTPTSSPAPTDVALTPPPYVRGTCPVTPYTALAGGSVPVVVMSEVRWVWGPEPWQAGVGQKVVLSAGVPNGYVDVSEISAERLPIGEPATPLSVRFPQGGGPGFVFGVGLPEPGCWLLTAVGATVSSSVVVKVGPQPADAPSPRSQNVPTTTAQLVPLDRCPTSPVDESRGFRAHVDGHQLWDDPDSAPWVAGKERKLIVSGSTDSVIAVAARVGMVQVPGSDQAPAFVTEQPVFTTPPPGSGSLGLKFTIPTAGCWSFTYIQGDRTSTIVAEVGVAAAVPGG